MGTTSDEYFELGRRLHTVEDLYTESHVERGSNGNILRFQSYLAQAPKYHKLADVFDEDKDAYDPNAGVGNAKSPQGKARQKLLTDKAALYLELAMKARENRKDWGRERILTELEKFVKLAPNARCGGSVARFEPKKNVITDTFGPGHENAERAGKAAKQAIERASKAAERAKKGWNDARDWFKGW